MIASVLAWAENMHLLEGFGVFLVFLIKVGLSSFNQRLCHLGKRAP